MIDITMQLRGYVLAPETEEEMQLMRATYKQNQMVRAKLYRVSKVIEPSVKQNGTMHACFALVADNCNIANMGTPKQVKFACKVNLDYRYEDRVAIRPDGTIVFEYRSFSFDDLKDMERLRIFDRAFEWCAGVLGITVEDLVENAKAKMQRI